MKDTFSLAINELAIVMESGPILYLIPVCLIYLYFKDKSSQWRTFFLWGTLFLFFLYLCPISGKILHYCLSKGTYFRIFWLVPLVPLFCYTATTIITHLHGIKRLCLFLVLLFFTTRFGSYMLKEPNFRPVTNPYKLTQESVDTAKWLPDGAYIVGADWLVPFIRQYNPTITLVNTRTGSDAISVELAKGYPDLAVLGPLVQNSGCDFVAIGQDKNLTIQGNWEDYGFHFYRGDNRCIIFVNEKSRFYQ